MKRKRIEGLVVQLPVEYHSVARELGKAIYQTHPMPKRMKLDSPAEVAGFFRAHLEDEMQEHFFVITLDARLNLLKRHLIAKGGLSEVHVRPRECFRPAIIDGAGAIVAVHNHPTGDPTPSEEDLVLTYRLRLAGQVMGIEVIDHLVVAKDGYTSIREKHWIALPKGEI